MSNLSASELLTWDQHFLHHSYVTGYSTSCADYQLLQRVPPASNLSQLPHLHRWCTHVTAADKENTRVNQAVDDINSETSSSLRFNSANNDSSSSKSKTQSGKSRNQKKVSFNFLFSGLCCLLRKQFSSLNLLKRF